MSLGCRRFRPIRRDSDSAESQSSASLAGSAPDVDAVPVRRPPPSTAAHAAAGPAPRHRRLKQTMSSGGSASSYDNVDEPSKQPRHARLQPWLAQPRSSHLVRPAAARVAGSGTDEALEEPEERLTPDAAPSVDISSSGTSVWRRPTLDGHFQVIPPTMIGVFDPTAQLSKFVRQTSTRRTSPVNFHQRRSGNTAKVPETVPKETRHFDDVRQANRVPSNTVSVHESPQRILAQNSQPVESTEATGFTSQTPCAEPSTIATSKTPEICEEVGKMPEPPADDGGQSSTSSSSSSSSSSSESSEAEEDKAEPVNVDDEEAVICAEIRSPAVDSERNQSPTSSASGTRSSYAAVDVTGQRSEQTATSDEQSPATTPPVTESRDDVAASEHVADSPPLLLAVSATSPSDDEVSIHDNSDVDVQQPADVKDEASAFTSSQSNKSSCSSHDEQEDDFGEQPELRISATDHGTSSPVMRINLILQGGPN